VNRVYYNEWDKFCVQWLKNLIADGQLPDGDVDDRDIREIQARDLAGYTQCHFFAGIGGWPLALRLAGWPDDRPVWTGSVPCQPLSVAGKQRGHADERHLWPAFHRLIAECRPPTIFGEQVAGALGLEWLAGIRADLEAGGYAVGAADLCAASVGAPHIRQRLYWMAHTESPKHTNDETAGRSPFQFGGSRRVGGLANTDGRLASDGGIQRGGQHRLRPQDGGSGGLADGMGDSSGAGLPGRSGERRNDEPQRAPAERAGRDAWADSILIPCRDGKARRIPEVESGIFPLVTGLPIAVDGLGPISRISALRGAGNAIVPQVAAEFIRAWL